MLYLLTDLKDYGWIRVDGQLQVVWDTPENTLKVKERLDFALSGCKCKTGCKTRRCKCLKSGKTCGPGCECVSCDNSPHSAFSSPPDNKELSDSDSDTSSSVADSDNSISLWVDQTEDIIYVFGLDEESIMEVS